MAIEESSCHREQGEEHQRARRKGEHHDGTALLQWRPAESIRTASRHSTIAPSTDWSLGLMSIVVANWSPCWPSNRGMVASP